MRSVQTLLASHPSSFSKPEWQLLRAYGIVNGFGPRNSPFLHGIIKLLAPMFRESNAEIHDFNYSVGGNESDRIKADQGFFIRMIRDSLKTRYSCVYYLCVSIIFYLSVRTFGSEYFNYK